MLYFAVVALFQVTEAINGRCRALVLGGGSDRGAFQAGAISGLITYLPQGEAMWDVVLGNGVGALNGMFVAQTLFGEEQSLNSTLSDFWLNFRRSQVYKSWWGGRMIGYFFKTGLYNDYPLSQTIKNRFDGTFDRFFLVGVTDLYESKYYLLNSSYSTDKLLGAVRASLNNHGNFPVVDIDQHQFVSGEVMFGVDVASAINYCQDLGYLNLHITVDIILVTNGKLAPFNAAGKNALEMGIRYFEIVNFHNVFERIENSKTNYKNVYFRTEIVLPEKISQKDAFPFSYDSKRHLYQEFSQGILAGKAAVSP
jgi:predicted patatin/cPLA2 family phospholipase